MRARLTILAIILALCSCGRRDVFGPTLFPDPDPQFNSELMVGVWYDVNNPELSYVWGKDYFTYTAQKMEYQDTISRWSGYRYAVNGCSDGYLELESHGHDIQQSYYDYRKVFLGRYILTAPDTLVISLSNSDYAKITMSRTQGDNIAPKVGYYYINNKKQYYLLSSLRFRDDFTVYLRTAKDSAILNALVVERDLEIMNHDSTFYTITCAKNDTAYIPNESNFFQETGLFKSVEIIYPETRFGLL